MNACDPVVELERVQKALFYGGVCRKPSPLEPLLVEGAKWA